MKKAFPIALIILGFIFVAGGGYTLLRGFDARDQVRDELIAQNITTPEDASIPNARVDDVATAKSMADVIEKHALTITGGKTYSEMGRFLAADGKGDTNDEKAAKLDAAGKPVANPLRNTAFQASALRTSLYSSVMAFEVATLVIGLGAMLLALGATVGGLGVVLASLAIPAIADRFHVRPAVANA